jgi:hypothetical protein
MHKASHFFSTRVADRVSLRARTVGVALAAMLVAVVTAAAASAAPPQFDPAAGLPTVGNFSPVTLNGTTQLTSASIAPFTITDDSGALDGWHVTLLVPDFENGTGAGCAVGSTASIDGSNLSMNAPVVSAAVPPTSMTGVTSAGFRDFTTPRTIIAAAAGDGSGTYDVAPEILRLVVPANVEAGTYCTQATIAITSGP